MDIEERIKALEDEFPAEKRDLKRILMDIRTFFMIAHTPLRRDKDMEHSPAEVNLEKKV
jgi:hypothetical protein